MLLGVKRVGEKVVSRVFVRKCDESNLDNLVANGYIPLPDGMTTREVYNEIDAVYKPDTIAFLQSLLSVCEKYDL